MSPDPTASSSTRSDITTIRRVRKQISLTGRFGDKLPHPRVQLGYSIFPDPQYRLARSRSGFVGAFGSEAIQRTLESI